MLTIINICCYLYASLLQEPKIEKYRAEWLEKRNMEGLQQRQNQASIYEQGLNDLKTWQGRIYPKKDFARFLGELFEIAGKNALAVGSISYKPAIEKNIKLLTYTIALNVSGNYGAVKKFIGDVYGLHNMTVIDTMTLGNNRLTEEHVDLKMQITSYFRPEGE